MPSIQKKSENSQGKAAIVVAAIGLLIIFGVFFQGDSGLIQYWKLIRERNDIKHKIEQLKTEQKQLEDEIKLLQHNEQYIEKIARERYKMGRESERVYIIQKEATQ